MNKTTSFLSAIVVVLVIALGIVAIMYQGELQKNSNLTEQSYTSEFYRTLNRILDDNRNSSMSPPVVMEDALAAAFGKSGWTADTLMALNATRVDVKLVYGYVNEASNKTVVLGNVPTPMTDYSHFQADGLTHRYMWQIVAYNATAELMPRTHDGYCLVDAATGEILPIPPS